MGYYIGLILLPLLAVLENSVLVDFRLAGGQPSLVLMTVIIWSWHSDLTEAIFFAFVGGIALDILNPIVPAGTSVIAPLIIIFAVKAVERLFYQVSIFALIGFVIAGTVIHHIVLYGIFIIQGINVPVLLYLQAYSVTTLTFNLVGTLPVFWILRRIQKRIPQNQSAWAVSSR